MTERPTDLRAEDIAEEMQISVSKAYELMLEMPRIKHQNTVRVARAAFDKWRRENTIQPCRASIDTPTVTTTTSFEESAGPSRLRTAKRRASLLATLSGAQPIRHTQPRTKPRSALPSSSSSTSSARGAKQKAR